MTARPSSASASSASTSSALPYGSWPSPITADQVAAGTHSVDGARFVGDEIWWLERMPAEGGRAAVRRAADDAPETLLPAPWNVGSRVHEYGGRSWTADETGCLWFVEKSDQRIWEWRADGEARPLTPADQGMRFVEPTAVTLPGVGAVLIAVRETHTGSRVPMRDIVAVPRDGSGAEDPAAIRSLVSGSGFLAYPRLSPDGTRLAWIAWDHPDMPWDATTLRVGAVVDGRVASWDVVAGADGGVSVLQPEWVTPPGGDTASAEVLFTADVSGRWNLYRSGNRHTGDRDTAPTIVAEFDADTGGPLWSLGTQWYRPLPDDRIVAVTVDGTDELVVIESDGTIRPVPSALSSRIQFHDVRGARVLLTGAGPTSYGGLWMLDLDEPEPRPRLVRGNVDEDPDPSWLPPARAITVAGPHGDVHAFVYPPTHPDVEGPAGELPPYLVLVHGGPTGHVGGEASPTVAFFTSRGIGVLDVNYGGSTGYGRTYRERLRGQWGIVDRDDVVAAASGIADAGIADPARLAIRGGSAGGWTVLCALTSSDRFAAGISRYGVADLRALAADTHDFEARYLDGLVGPLPEADDVYTSRSPLSHLDRFTTPMLIEQGMDDLVVPPSQSEAVRDALAARGIAHAYLAFEGEGHGFRRAETLRTSLEAELSFLGQVLGFDPPGVPVLPLHTGY